MLQHHVSHVVIIRAKEQVLRSDARPIVAMVKDMESCRDLAFMDFPGDSVGGVHLPGYFDLSVAVRVAIGGPFPATIADHDLAHESKSIFLRNRHCLILGRFPPS
jgi:hypothetical protein